MKSTLVAEPETVSPVRERGFEAGGSKKARSPRPTGAGSIVLVGASFRTSSLEFREALLRRLEPESRKLIAALRAREHAELVTCNRIEILMTTESNSPGRAVAAWVSKIPGGSPRSIYCYEGVDAVAHIFRVASGLDSLVLGEEQILSQVRDAGIAARRSRSSLRHLSVLFDASVNVGKRVRSTLAEPDKSVSSMAIDFARERLRSRAKNVLLIGTGKTTRLAAEQLRGAKVFVATRRTAVPSFPGATIVSHKDLRRVASKCDLIISATKHQGYVLRKGDLDDKRRVVLDLGFPRNIDPRLNTGSTEVYNLEDLAKASSSRRNVASPQARLAEEMVVAEAESFSRWLLASRQSPALSQVYQWAERTRREEAGAALRRLPDLSERERKVVESMSKRLVSKLLAPTTAFAKESSPELPQGQRLDLVKRIFQKARK